MDGASRHTGTTDGGMCRVELLTWMYGYSQLMMDLLFFQSLMTSGTLTAFNSLRLLELFPFLFQHSLMTLAWKPAPTGITCTFIPIKDSHFYKWELLFQTSGGVESPPEALMFSKAERVHSSALILSMITPLFIRLSGRYPASKATTTAPIPAIAILFQGISHANSLTSVT